MSQVVIIGDVDWLRNDYVSPIKLNGITYPTAEHAYQASKFNDNNLKQDIADMDLRRARHTGRHAKIRDDWMSIREIVMETILREKFSDDLLGDRLAKTGSDDIVMTGYDDFWGQDDNGSGSNRLGEILQNIRREIQFKRNINPDDYSSTASSVRDTSLSDELRDEPSEDLFDVVQDLFTSVKDVLSLVDADDTNVDLMSRMTGQPSSVVQDAISKVRELKSSVNAIRSLLGEDVNDVSVADDHSQSTSFDPRGFGNMEQNDIDDIDNFDFHGYLD